MLCAVCHQDIAKPCKGRITGRTLTYHHGYPAEKPVIYVSSSIAEQLQKDLEKGWQEFVQFQPNTRRKDGKKAMGAKPSPADETEGNDCYSPDHQRVGEITIAQFLALLPEVFKRRDT